MSATRKPLVAGNWKMHNNHLEALALTQQLAFRLTDKDFAAADIVVLPPFTALRSVQTLVHGDKLKLQYGAQDLSPHADGAYTGDISGRMLAKLGCSYVLTGHSERRQYHGEDDALVNAKVRAALAHELTPVLCVGEPLAVREQNGQLAHCVGQLDGGLDGLTGEQASGLVIAYEPVWAIGTGKTATTEQAEAAHAFIRGLLVKMFDETVARRVRIQYGGSVKPSNARELMSQPDVDGALVGGASLEPRSFAEIIKNSI
jgi:triosephosphate isomerase